MSAVYRRDRRNRELEAFVLPEPKRLGNFSKKDRKKTPLKEDAEGAGKGV